MLQLIYIFAFTIIAFLAFGNLFRSLLTIGVESHRSYSRPDPRSIHTGNLARSATHPELLNERGEMIDEPLLVMRSITMEDAREQLDDLYNASPGSSDGARGEA